MAGWHQQCNEYELGQTPGDGEGQGVTKSETGLLSDNKFWFTVFIFIVNFHFRCYSQEIQFFEIVSTYHIIQRNLQSPVCFFLQRRGNSGRRRSNKSDLWQPWVHWATISERTGFSITSPWHGAVFFSCISQREISLPCSKLPAFIHCAFIRRWVLGMIFISRSGSWSVAKSCLTVTSWTTAHHASLPIMNSRSLHKLMSIESVMPTNNPSSPSPPPFDLSQNQCLFQWVSSLHQLAKVL